jgi:hypothetical protein
LIARVAQKQRPRWPVLLMAGAGVALAALFVLSLRVVGANPAADIDQCRNGGLATPQTFVQCTLSAWVNGNAGAQNSHYREGESISYRVKLSNLKAGDQVSLIIGYDVIHGGNYAIDYLTSNDRWQSPETNSTTTPDVPSSGFPGIGAATLANIPAPPGSIHADPTKTFASGQCIGTASTGTGPLQPATSFAAVPAAERQMEFYGISGAPVLSYFGPDPDFTDAGGGDQEQQLELVFTANGADVVISWGGHIASRLDWGCADGPLSAGGISGSPYHMRVKDLEVNGTHFTLGNQDRSLSAAAVIVPPDVELTKTPSVTDVCSQGGQVTYTYVVSNPGGVAISGSVVDDNGTPGITGDDVTVGTYNNLAPGASAQYTLVRTISSTTTNTATTTATTTAGLSDSDTASATVTAHTCTIDITKSPSVTDVCTQGGEVTYTYVVTNTGDFFNASGTVTDDVLGAIGSFGPLAPGASATLTKTATITATTVNTGTANATFADAAATTASDTASATVTAHTCTIDITKSPSVTDVCTQGGEVTYTYVVTNTGDFFNASGTVTDDVLGAIGSFGPLAPGESATLTATATINATTTNVATATAQFEGDGTATDTATATVTAHNCTISITKSPSESDVCNGSSTSVEYTYVVTNNSDFYSVSGSVSDDQLGSIGNFGPLAPGASETLTASATIGGTVTNTATATGTFTDSVGATDSDSASATVTGHDCTITVTKSADDHLICIGDSTTYDFTVTNNSDLYSWTGSVVDNVVGTIAASVTLAPGQTATYNNVAGPPLNVNTTNTVTASGSFDDPASSSASDTDSDTVEVEDCGGNIFHTGTTCEQFHLGAPPVGLAGTELSTVNYKTKGQKINSLNPGVFFYYTAFTAPANSFTVNIVQSIAAGEGFSTFFGINQDGSEIRVFNNDCSNYTGATASNGNGQATINFNQAGIAGQTFVISVKYTKAPLEGVTQPPDLLANHRDVQYNWETKVNGTVVDSDPDGLLLHKT